MCRSERIAKYNRFLEIEAELGRESAFDNPLKWRALSDSDEWLAGDMARTGVMDGEPCYEGCR
jgi:Enolase, C-terminal TIM barrel domain